MLFGYADDTPEQTERRLLQSNLVGPAGFVSMEDGVVGSFIQRAIALMQTRQRCLKWADATSSPGESRQRSRGQGFWQAYRTMMDL